MDPYECGVAQITTSHLSKLMKEDCQKFRIACWNKRYYSSLGPMEWNEQKIYNALGLVKAERAQRIGNKMFQLGLTPNLSMPKPSNAS